MASPRFGVSNLTSFSSSYSLALASPPHFPDVWSWLTTLPPLTQWTTSTTSLPLFTSHTSMHFTITKNRQPKNPYITFSLTIPLHTPIPLWISKPLHLKPSPHPSLDEQTIAQLFRAIITTVVLYGPCKKSPSRLQMAGEHREAFNLAFLTLVFLVCVYEAPQDLRWAWLKELMVELASSRAREASRQFVRLLGSNLEEQWMRSVNLGVTNWIEEFHAVDRDFKMPSLVFSYAVSASGLWKVQLYCPIVAMGVEDSSSSTQDERLMFSLKYQQLEGVIQLAYKVAIKESWIDVVVKVDNIRCDVYSLVSDTLMSERGYGSEEKHFPSRISLQLTPTLQTDILSVSVSKSTDNPIREVGREKALEGTFDTEGLGLTLSATEIVTVSMKPWKFEQSAYGDSAILNWFLHDTVKGGEVFSSKPSRLALFQPRAWFRDRYSNVSRPFTRRGGVIFAGDEYGDRVVWKVCGGAVGKTMEWEVRGWIWLTYWPNKQRTTYSETRRLEFKEVVQLHL